MKLFRQERTASTLVILGLAAILVVLAVLQFRWSRQISDADAARIRGRLQSSLLSFRQDLQRELGAICFPFQSVSDMGSGDILNGYADAYRMWFRGAAHPGLIANLYVLTAANGPHARMLRLNPETGQFEQQNSPPALGRLPERLLAVSGHVLYMLEDFEEEPPRPGAEHHRRERPMFPHRPHSPFTGLWAIDESLPALVHPNPVYSGPNAAGRPTSLDWAIIQLDPHTLAEGVFPELAERYFAGPDGLEYQILVLGRDDRTVYASDSAFQPGDLQEATALINLMGGPPAPPPPRNLLVPGNDPDVPGAPHGPYGRRDAMFSVIQLDPIHYSNNDQDWRLAVRHRKGSLEAAVAATRLRNLELSFGVLAVLAATMALIIANTHRAQRLARSQMGFVAGISHELRTPLAVIRSAADNIADGVVDNKEQFVRYGEVIRKQARQLTHLIDQVLLFASTREQLPQYNLRPLATAAVIDAALNDTADMVARAGCHVERKIEPDLPPVVGDPEAVSHCLQNLITNAVKYGGSDHWIGVQASAARDQENGKRLIRISVEDHGAGIPPSEQREIFKPFYRSPQIIASQIHGTGLGLTLARSLAEAVGGRLTVASEVGRGSVFHLELRAADAVPTESSASAAPHRSPTNGI